MPIDAAVSSTYELAKQSTIYDTDNATIKSAYYGAHWPTFNTAVNTPIVTAFI